MTDTYRALDAIAWGDNIGIIVDVYGTQMVVYMDRWGKLKFELAPTKVSQHKRNWNLSGSSSLYEIQGQIMAMVTGKPGQMKQILKRLNGKSSRGVMLVYLITAVLVPYPSTFLTGKIKKEHLFDHRLGWKDVT